MDQAHRDWHESSLQIPWKKSVRAAGSATPNEGKHMKKLVLDMAIVLTVLLAMSGSAYASVLPPPVPDNCVTSLLLAGAAGGLGLLRKLMR
jgi:hypothetical protein